MLLGSLYCALPCTVRTSHHQQQTDANEFNGIELSAQNRIESNETGDTMSQTENTERNRNHIFIAQKYTGENERDSHNVIQ